MRAAGQDEVKRNPGFDRRMLGLRFVGCKHWSQKRNFWNATRKDIVTTMGDRGVNSSIGAQWKDRVDELDKAAREIPESERGKTQMNAKLKRCK